MELFRGLFSKQADAPFTSPRLTHMHAADTVHKLPPTHTDIEYTQLRTQHLLGSATLSNATDVTQMFGCHPRLQEEQRRTEEVLVFPKFPIFKLLTTPVRHKVT